MSIPMNAALPLVAATGAIATFAVANGKSDPDPSWEAAKKGSAGIMMTFGGAAVTGLLALSARAPAPAAAKLGLAYLLGSGAVTVGFLGNNIRVNG